MTLSRKRGSIDFDQWAPTYEQPKKQFYYEQAHKAVLTLVASCIEPQSILDIGCGTGRLLRTAKIHWPHATLTGVDPSPGMIEIARQLTPDATFQIGMAEKLPLPDAMADVAISTISFHHWKDPLTGVREVARVLRPGGIFFLATVAPLSWPFLWMLHHPRSQTPTELRDIFREAGLQLRLQRFALAGFVIMTIGQSPEQAQANGSHKLKTLPLPGEL